jgi:hypothetical protein
MKKILLLSISVFITAALLYYLISSNSGVDWKRIFFHLNLSYLFWYLVLYGLGLFLRTYRYHLLLRSVKTPVLPAFWNLALVTGVRNMLVDFPPARTGSLS